MKRELKIALYTLIGILCVLFFLLGIPLMRGQLLEREFLSHELNQKIVARSPGGSFGPGDVDVTDLFGPNINRIDLERELTSIGYRCNSEGSTDSALACDREAGYSLVCRKIVLLSARLVDRGAVRSVDASFHLLCL